MEKKKYTYEEAVSIRAEYLAVKEQLPEIIEEAKKSRTIASIARDLKFHRAQIYNIIK